MRRLLLVCLALGLMCSAPAGDRAAAKQQEKSAPPRIAAQEACRAATRLACQWDRGAKLIYATGRTFDFRFDGRSSRWGFRFVSGDGKRVAAFAVNMANRSSLVRMTKDDAKRPSICHGLIDLTDWKIDSPEACEIAKGCRLGAWLNEHPEFDPTYSGNRFELASHKQYGAFWRVKCVFKPPKGTGKREAVMLGISATDGRLLFSQPARFAAEASQGAES